MDHSHNPGAKTKHLDHSREHLKHLNGGFVVFRLLGLKEHFEEVVLEASRDPCPANRERAETSRLVCCGGGKKVCENGLRNWKSTQIVVGFWIPVRHFLYKPAQVVAHSARQRFILVVLPL